MKPETVHSDVLFEPADVDARLVVSIGVGILVTATVVIALLYFYFAYLANRRARLSPPPLPMNLHGDVIPPEPRIQASPSSDLHALRIYEDAVLEKYAWIDKSKGRLGIPIGRAMQLIAQRGIPPQKAPDSLKLFDPRAGTRATGFEGKVEPEPR